MAGLLLSHASPPPPPVLTVNSMICCINEVPGARDGDKSKHSTDLPSLAIYDTFITVNKTTNAFPERTLRTDSANRIALTSYM